MNFILDVVFDFRDVRIDLIKPYNTYKKVCLCTWENSLLIEPYRRFISLLRPVRCVAVEGCTSQSVDEEFISQVES